MGVIDRKLKLFDSIARLRRVGRQVPGNPDLAKVRAALEQELGATVSRRFAARVLGVSHTALQRWIESGDLPLVYSQQGRLEVPVPALLDLSEAVEIEHAQHGGRYVLAPTMSRRRRAAQRIRIDDLKVDDPHARAQARSLAYHRAVARGLRKAMVEEARHVLFRWRDEGKIDTHYAEQWEYVLTQPIAEIRKAIVEESQEADDLRQNSPLAGLLSEPERRRIMQEVV